MMTREEIIIKLKKYFTPEELVSKEVYSKLGSDSWLLFATETLHCLLIVREELNKPITINNWKWGGSFSQRGFRENTSPIVRKKTSLYLSAHVFGQAFDFDVEGMVATEVREWIKENADLFPCKVRLERNINGKVISWVHLDTKQYEKNPKVYLFDV